MPAKSKTNELHLARIYDAAVQDVWDAWNDPQQAAKWWGPRGFTITTHSKDLRPGGHWTYTMHGPDGADYPNKTIYHEVERLRKLVYDHGGSDDRPPLFRVTVVFTDLGDKTRLDMTMTLPTREAAEEMRQFINKAGGDATWDRLAEFLHKEATGDETFVINRSFDAPLDQMFELWTDPKHLANWLPPTGFTMQFLRADIREGGSSLYVMQNDSGLKMYGRAQYLSVEKPHRLTYTQEFCDENENPARHPMAPTWPASMLTTVEFAAESEGRTRVTVTWRTHGTVTPEELETFINGRAGMTQGWSGSFDKLDQYLASS